MHVKLHRSVAYSQSARYLLVAQAATNQERHLVFASCQPVQRVFDCYFHSASHLLFPRELRKLRMEAAVCRPCYGVAPHLKGLPGRTRRPPRLVACGLSTGRQTASNPARSSRHKKISSSGQAASSRWNFVRSVWSRKCNNDQVELSTNDFGASPFFAWYSNVS